MNDWKRTKSDFPIFRHYPELCYLDNAATTHKPLSVIRAIDNFYSTHYGTVSRGLYPLSSGITEAVHNCRSDVARYIGAKHPEDIVFTYGTTDSINKLAHSFIKPKAVADNNIVISTMEHHANILPWQIISSESGVEIRTVRLTPSNELDLIHLEELIDKKTILISIAHVSNVLGVANPLDHVVQLASRFQIPLMVDAAQSMALKPFDVVNSGIDFLAFSGHKMFGPTGIGVLYSAPKHQANFRPHFVGGGMVRDVSLKHTEYLEYPVSMEPGTPNIAGIIGLSAALEYIENLDQAKEATRINKLSQKLEKGLAEMGIQVVNPSVNDSHIVTFNVPGVHPHDISYYLGGHQVCVRAGHHCAQPLHEALNCQASVRASLTIYNEEEDVIRLLKVLQQCINYFN